MTIDELEKAWNAEPRENAWEELGLDEIVAFAQEMERERILRWCITLINHPAIDCPEPASKEFMDGWNSGIGRYRSVIMGRK